MSINIPTSNGGHVPVGYLGTVQTVSVGAASAATSNVVGSNVVILHTTEACHIAIAASPTATTSDFYLEPNLYVPLHVHDNVDKIACIKVTGGAGAGTLYVTELD